MRVLLGAGLALSWFGCAGEIDDPPNTPSPSTGRVTSPEHGAVIAGDPSTISLHVAGSYDGDRTLDIEVLADPTDLSSWTVIASTEAAAGAFAIDVVPAGNGATARWPVGGVLRLRVSEHGGTPLGRDDHRDGDNDGDDDGDDSDGSVIAIVNPAAPAASWQFLVEKSVGSLAETTAYYQAINAPPTLPAFLQGFGFPTGETVARYYNRGDLGIGREMHCRAVAAPAGGLACYVRNFGTFGGTVADALTAVESGQPFATVAMVYTPPIDAPNAVRFMVYGADENLTTSAQLDTRGDNTSIPHNCLNCHGGRSQYDTTAHAVTNARFLPFDPAAFDFSATPVLTFASQQEAFRNLDRLIMSAGATDAVGELVTGMFGGPAYDESFVPSGWSTTASDRRVYREVIAPYCRSCHVSFQRGAGDSGTFASADSLRRAASSVVSRICGAGPKGMPAAEATARDFFASPARGLLLTWLEAPGACAP